MAVNMRRISLNGFPQACLLPRKLPAYRSLPSFAHIAAASNLYCMLRLKVICGQSCACMQSAGLLLYSIHSGQVQSQALTAALQGGRLCFAAAVSTEAGPGLSQHKVCRDHFNRVHPRLSRPEPADCAAIQRQTDQAAPGWLGCFWWQTCLSCWYAMWEKLACPAMSTQAYITHASQK